MKKKHLKALKKQDQDIRAKKAVGIWKRRTWKRGLSRKGSGVVTPATAPVTRAGSENEDEDENEDDEEGAADDDENGEEKTMIPIRRRSEGLTVDVCPTSPSKSPCSPNTQTNHYHHSRMHSCLPHLLRP